MSRSQRITPKLGLLALALYAAMLMSGATSAGAAAWKVNGKEVTSELSPLVTISEVEGKDLTLSTEVLKLKVEILCTGLQAINVKLKPEGAIAFGSGLKYTGCITKLNGSVTPECEPGGGGGGETGVISSKLLKGALVSHEGSNIVRFEATEGETLAIATLPASCPIGTSITLLGKLTLKDTSLSKETVTHLAVVGPLTELWVISKTAEHQATVSGSLVTALAGEHLGLSWGESVAAPPKETTWLVKGKEVTTTLSPLVAANEIESGGATLLTKIAGLKVEVNCKSTQLTNVKLQSKGAIAPEARVNFSECQTKLNEKVNGACEPSNEGIEPGAISSQLLKGSLIWHEGSGLVGLEPASGETLAVIETSGGCSIGSKVPVLGKVTLKDVSLSKESETHLVTAGPLTELWAISKTEEHKATLDGSAIVRLGGAHGGMAWSGFVLPPPVIGWRIKGSEVTAVLSPFVSVNEVEGKDLGLSSEILKIKVTFLCTNLQAINVRLKPKSVIAFESGLKFSGCVTKLNGSESKACEPGGGETGVIKSKLLKGALVLHEGAGIVRFEATEGKTLATTVLPAECPIGTSVPVLGKITLKDSFIATEAVTHLASVGPLTELFVISETVEHKATASGSIVTALSGEHSGLLWSGVVE
jgi:hypothetical protein